MSTSFQEWFCLRSGRRNFQIDPVRDKDLLLGQPEWQEQIDSRLKRAQLLGTPVRLIWWGQFGIGKTHRLRHTEHVIKSAGYKYYPSYVIATDLQDKTGFERLHYELINSLNREEMQKMVSSYQLKVRTGEPGVPSLRDICSNNSDVEAAFKSFASDNDNLVLPAWRFLCGLTLRGNELALAGVTKDGLDSSHDFSAVLGALARIIYIESGRELLYLIDEAENLTKVTNKTAESRWQESLRSMLDVPNLSIVATVGAERFQDVPKLLVMPDIVRRVQKDNYVQMEAFKLPDVTVFVKGLLEKWIDGDQVTAAETEIKASAPDYARELFPFTKGAFEKFCEYAVVDPRTAKPSEILARLDKIAAEAYFRNSRVITRNLLTDMGIA